MMMPGSREFREIYKESGILTSYDSYVRRMALSISAIFSLTAVASMIFHSHLLHLTGLRLLQAVFSLPLAASGLMAFALLYYPYHQRNQMRETTEEGLIYTLRQIPLFQVYLPGIVGFGEWIMLVPNVGGGRAAVIAAALGAIVVGIRTLWGKERTTTEVD